MPRGDNRRFSLFESNEIEQHNRCLGIAALELATAEKSSVIVRFSFGRSYIAFRGPCNLDLGKQKLQTRHVGVSSPTCEERIRRKSTRPSNSTGGTEENDRAAD